MTPRITCALFAVTLFAGCGETPDPDTTPDAAVASTWMPLVTKTWSLPPGGENESDLQIINITEDMYVGGIRPLAPEGTHHTLLFRGLSGTNAIYASGVGTNELMFPPGTGLKLTAGTVLGLQLHIYNTRDETLTGLSGVEVLPIDQADVVEEIDVFLPGPRNLSLPANQVSTKSGTCTVSSAQKLFALFPHMHQLGTHFKTTLTIGGVDQVLHDEAYDFQHQPVKAFAPIQLTSGDKITTECTWNNTGSTVVTYGESSTTEMCYSILYRYPRGSEEFCSQ